MSEARRAVAWVVILCAAGLCGCSDTPTPSSRLSFLLVTLDTLRADRLGSYGYAGAETPNLDRLASEGVRFEQAISPVPSTLPAHATILTGLFPQAHGVRDNGTYVLPGDLLTLGEALSAEGYDTAAFVSSFVVDSRFGLDRGFETYFDFDDSPGERRSSRVERVGGETAARALEWLSQPRERPFFAWIHLYDPHAPFEAPEPYRSRFADRPYDGEVAYTDAVVGEILDRLESLGASDSTLVVVVGDHGESLGEHGETYHSWFIYDATLKVPFLARLPGIIPEDLVIEEQVRLADVAPTALELLGVSRDRWQGMQGTSLAPWLTEGAREHLPAYAESLVPQLQFGWSGLKAIRERGFKYIEAPRPELYDLAADPGETRNLVSEREDVARELEERLEALERELRRGEGEHQPSPIDEEAIRKLQSLGYVAGTARAASSSPGSGLVDPKDRIDDYRELTSAMEIADSAAPDEAVAVLAPLARRLPTHRLLRYRLGQAYLKTGAHRLAVQELDLALEMAPAPTRANGGAAEGYLANNYYFLGVAYRGAGRPAEAEHHFERAIELSGHALSHLELGELWIENGRRAEGIEALRRAAAAGSDRAEEVQAIGSSLARHGQLEDAVAAFAEAAGLGTTSSLEADWCAALLQLGRLQEGLSHCEEAVRLDEASARAHLHLGIALEMADRASDALRHYERAVELDPTSRARERLRSPR